MIQSRIQDEGKFLVSIIIQNPDIDTPVIIPLKLSKTDFEKSTVTVQAINREGGDIFDYQATHDLKRLAGSPINRRLTGSAVQTEWKI